MRWIRLVAVFALASALLTVGGCNTVEGAGKDLQELGKNTSRVARENNTYTEPETPPNANPYR